MQDASQARWEAWADEASKVVRQAEEAAARAEAQTTEASRKRKPMDQTEDLNLTLQQPPTKDRPLPNTRDVEGREAQAKAATATLPTLHTAPPLEPTPQRAAVEQRVGSINSDSESDTDQRKWKPWRLDDPEEEEERMTLILEEEIRGIKKIPGATITKDYLEVVAKRTGAEPAALWGLYKNIIKYPPSTPAGIDRWPRSSTTAFHSWPTPSAALASGERWA